MATTANPTMRENTHHHADEGLRRVKETTQQTTSNVTETAQGTIRNVERTAYATKNVFQRTTDPNNPPHSVAAQRIVFMKGVFDVFLSLSLIFFPSFVFDGYVPTIVSGLTTLPKFHWEADSQTAFALSSLIMGCGIAGISAGESTSDNAYKVIAALNGAFAGMSLLGCILFPHKFGSSFLFLAGLQDVFWSSMIMRAGNYGLMDTFGLSVKAIQHEFKRLDQKDERVGNRTSQGLHHTDLGEVKDSRHIN